MNAPQIPSVLGDEISLPDHAEDEIAQFFTALHGDRRRYVATWGRWLSWDDKRWCVDDTLATFDLVRVCCRERAKIAESDKIAVVIASAKTVAAVERLARADRRHAATPDFFDSDPMLLNTPGGTVDLRTGTMRAHSRDDLITKI